MSISAGNHVFYYMVRDTLCFLSMTEPQYPKRRAFMYLDEVADIILGELMKEFGNNVSFAQTNVQQDCPSHAIYCVCVCVCV